MSLRQTVIDDETASRYYNELNTNAVQDDGTKLKALTDWADAKDAERNKHEWDHLTRVYTDFDNYISDEGYSDLDEESRYRIANRQFIANQLGETVEDQGQLYPAKRDIWTEQAFGKKGLSEKEAFGLIQQGVQSRNDVVQSANEIPGDIALGLFNGIGTGTQVEVPKLVSIWKERNAEKLKKLPKGWESGLLESASAYAAETEGMLRDYAQPLKQVYDHLAAVTGRETQQAGEQNPKNLQDMESLADTLATMPPEVRDRAYAAVVLGAKQAGQEPKEFLEQWGESWSRTLNMFRSGSMVMQEDAAHSELQILKEAPKVWKEKDTGKLTVYPGFDQSNFEEVTPEERPQLTAEAQKKFDRLQVYRELFNIADNQFDPIKKINEGGFGGFMESMAYGSPQALAYTGMALIPGVGPWMTGAAIYSEEYNKLRLDGIDPNTARTVAAPSALLQAGLERVGAKMIFGKLPQFEKLMTKIGNPARVGRAGSAGIRLGGALIGENIVEGAQDLVTPAVQDVASALSADVPNVNWGETLGQWGSSRLDVLAATIPGILIGTGVATMEDGKRFNDFNERLDLYKSFGMDEAAIKRVEDAQTPQDRQAALQTEYKNLTPDNIKAGISYMETKIDEARSIQEDPNLPTMTREQGENGKPVFVVRDEKGVVSYRSEDEQSAMTAHREMLRTRITGATTGIVESLQYIDRVNQALSRGEDVQKLLLDDAPRTLLDDYEANPTEQNLDRLFETVRAFGMDINEPAELANFPILASNRGALTDGIYKSIIRIQDGATGIEVMRDFSQDNLKRAFAEGRISMDWVREQLNQVIPLIESERTERKLRTETDTDVIESFSDVAVAYMNGKIRDEQVPGGLRGFLRRIAVVVKDIFRRSYRLKRAIAEGKVSGDFTAYLAESVGLDQQSLVDTTTDRVSNEVLADTDKAVFQSRAQAQEDVPTIRAANGSITGPANYSIGAFHGTPHKVDKFSTEKIGTGEGAQAYGWGLYFAENQKVADDYKKTLSAKNPNAVTRFLHDGAELQPIAKTWKDQDPKSFAIRSLSNVAAGLSEDGKAEVAIKAVRRTFPDAPLAFEDAVAEEARNAKPNAVENQKGNLYSVELDVEPEDLLDWDKPLSEQSPKVQAALAKLDPDSYSPEGNDYDANEPGQITYNRIPRGVSGSAKVASDTLLAAGIPGIRYADQGSRLNPKTLEEARARVRIAQRDAENSPQNAILQNILKDEEKRLSDIEQEQQRNTSNFVIFDESKIKVTGVNGQPVAIQDAMAAPAVSTDTNYSIGSPAFSQWFGKSKAVDSEGKPMVVYHGTQRPDRVGSRFRKARATSGPMAFFTNDSSIASSYATGKRDTSAEMPSDYAEWFKYKEKGMRSPVAIDRAWWSLSPEERAAVNERIYTIGYSDWDAGEGKIVADSKSIMSRDSIDYELRQAKGNGLRALVEMWLTSGSLFNREERFLEVLQAAGVKGATLDDPNAVRSGVYPVYLSIQNPLDTANIPGDVISALEQAGKRKRAKQAAGNNPDTWDKNTISGPEWLSALKEDIAKGTTHAWTRIPDWATETLSSLGYDGIKDTGGKHGGDSHQVWIPFNETQVKSATGNRGTYDSSNPDINYSIGKATDSVTPIAINFPAPNIPSDIKNLRKYIRQMIADSLQGRTIIVERTGTEVKFTAESRAESVSKARMPFQAAPMLEAEKIVLNGVPVDISEPDQNKKTYKGTRLFRRFAIPVSIGGDVYASHFTVREPNDFEQNKGVFYEFNIGKKMEPRDMGLPPASASRPSKDDSPFNLDSEINIAALINKVNGGTSNYSISSQSEIDRVNRAMSGVTRGPSERLAIYERAKAKFGNLMAWGRDELSAMQETGADAPTMRRTQILQGLGELDAILSVLPPEVRGRIGGYTKLASIAPMDVFKDGEKVSEVSGMNGALISAWMRDGLNIGQAQKKVDFPPGYTAKENLATARSDRAIADFFKQRIKKIDAELEKFLAREYRTAILDLVENSRPKAGDNNVRKSTLGPETQRVADLVQRATLMDEDAVAERMLQLEQSMQSSEDNSALVEEWGILNTFGDLDSRNSDTLAQAHKWFRDQLKAGRESWSIKEEARIAQNRERARQTVEWLGKVSEADRQRNKTNSERASDFANQILLSHASFEQFVTAILPEEIAADFSKRLRKADVAAQKAEIEQREGILDALRAGAKSAGTTTAKAMESLKTEFPNAVRYLEGRMVKNTKLTIEQAEKIVRGEIDRGDLKDADVRNLADELAALPADTRKEYITLKQVVSSGKEVRLPMTRGKAIQYILSWNQPDVRDKMMRTGWTEDSIADLRNLTSDTVSQAMLAHAQELYGKGYAATNPVYARMFGMNMPQVRNYAPTRFTHSNDVKDIGLDGSPVATGTTPGFAKSRVSHSAKIAPEDALSVMQQHILMQSHWVNFAELAREYRSLITNPDVRASIKQNYGEAVLKNAEEWAAQMEQRGGNQSRETAWINAILGSVIGGQSVASLGFNLKTLAMQLDNAVRFGLSLDMKQIVSAMQSPDQLIEDIKTVFESDALQTRLLGGATAETRFLFQKYGGKVGAGAKIAEVSMGAINWMDSATTSFSAAIVYRANLNEALAAGMPENLARETALDAASAAIYRFAQPVSFGQKSNIENSGNMLTKAFFLFMSDPRLKTAIMADSIRGLVTGRGDKWTHIRRLVAVELMAVLSHVVASAYRDAFTDDDDEEIWQLGGWVRALALAPLQGYFIAGSVFDGVLSQLADTGFYTPTQNPLLSVMQSGIRAVKHADDILAFDDRDALLKEWVNIARMLAVAPPMAAPAVLLNAVKPIFGAVDNAKTPE